MQGTGKRPRQDPPRRLATSIAPLILLAILFGLAHPLRAGQTDLPQEAAPTAGNLNLLLLPFFDPSIVPRAAIPIVFLRRPTPPALRAAAIVASWLSITLVCILMAAILGTLLRQHALFRLEGDT